MYLPAGKHQSSVILSLINIWSILYTRIGRSPPICTGKKPNTRNVWGWWRRLRTVRVKAGAGRGRTTQGRDSLVKGKGLGNPHQPPASTTGVARSDTKTASSWSKSNNSYSTWLASLVEVIANASTLVDQDQPQVEVVVLYGKFRWKCAMCIAFSRVCCEMPQC